MAEDKTEYAVCLQCGNECNFHSQQCGPCFKNGGSCKDLVPFIYKNVQTNKSMENDDIYDVVGPSASRVRHVRKRCYASIK